MFIPLNSRLCHGFIFALLCCVVDSADWQLVLLGQFSFLGKLVGVDFEFGTSISQRGTLNSIS